MFFLFPTGVGWLKGTERGMLIDVHWSSMREFTTPSFPVYMYDREGGYVLKTMGEVWMNLPPTHEIQLTICLFPASP